MCPNQIEVGAGNPLDPPLRSRFAALQLRLPPPSELGSQLVVASKP